MLLCVVKAARKHVSRGGEREATWRSCHSGSAFMAYSTVARQFFVQTVIRLSAVRRKSVPSATTAWHLLDVRVLLVISHDIVIL